MKKKNEAPQKKVTLFDFGMKMENQSRLSDFDVNHRQ